MNLPTVNSSTTDYGIELNSRSNPKVEISKNNYSRAFEAWDKNQVIKVSHYNTDTKEVVSYQCRIKKSPQQEEWFLSVVLPGCQHDEDTDIQAFENPLFKLLKQDTLQKDELTEYSSTETDCIHLYSDKEYKEFIHAIDVFSRQFTKFLQLLYDIHYNQLKIAKYNSLESANINCPYIAGMTPLMKLCKEGYYSSLLELLKRNPDLTICTEGVGLYPKTALHYACKPQTTACLDLLLDYEGAKKLPTGENSIHVLVYSALKSPSVSHLKKLIEKGSFDVDANVSVRAPGNTPLMKSVCFGPDRIKVKKVNYLMANGANIHLKNERGNTAFHHAAAYGCVECMQILLNKGADLAVTNNDDKTPFQCYKQRMDFDDAITENIPTRSECLVKAITKGYNKLATEMIKAGWEIDSDSLLGLRKSRLRKKYQELRNNCK